MQPSMCDHPNCDHIVTVIGGKQVNVPVLDWGVDIQTVALIAGGATLAAATATVVYNYANALVPPARNCQAWAVYAFQLFSARPWLMDEDSPIVDSRITAVLNNAQVNFIDAAAPQHLACDCDFEMLSNAPTSTATNRSLAGVKLGCQLGKPNLKKNFLLPNPTDAALTMTLTTRRAWAPSADVRLFAALFYARVGINDPICANPVTFPHSDDPGCDESGGNPQGDLTNI